MLCEFLNTQLLLAALQSSFMTHDMPHKGMSYLCRDRELITLTNETIHKVAKPQRQETISGQRKITCENDILNLSCEPGNVLNILEADYGRKDRTPCSSHIHFFKKCSSAEETYNKVKQRCSSKRSCNLKASNEEFGDPCPNMHKYLEVKYSCEKVTPFNANSITMCEGDSKSISCPEGKTILVLNAMYGRQDVKTCVHTLMKDTNCKAKNSLDVISNKCDDKETCHIYSSNGWFSDPCPGTYKYLNVEYQCLPASPPPSLITPHSIAICEGDTKNIACPRGQGITIVDAIYGRQDVKTCVHTQMKDTNCRSKDSLKVVSDKCNHKENCTVSSSNSWYGDPCVGTYKYLLIKYHCHPVPEKKTIEISPVAENKTIEISPGAPIIVGTTADSVTFYIDRLTPDLFKYYKVQMKEAEEDLWYDALDGYGFDFSKDQTIGGLDSYKIYDIRIIVKDVDFKANCIPFTRFITKKSSFKSCEKTF